jgi:hypothetical protein
MSSEEPELHRYLTAMNARGAQGHDEDGGYVISILSDVSVPNCVWYEECAHVLQFERDGAVALSCEDRGVSDNEVEVARCLLARQARKGGKKLEGQDVIHYQAVLGWAEVQRGNA